MHNYCTPHVIKENSENFLIHRCNYILLSQVYCVWQIVKTPTIILNNRVQSTKLHLISGSFSTHLQELADVHSALAYVIHVWRQLACRIRIVQASCRQTCITCASAECTVANYWWRVQEIHETCRVLHKNKFGNKSFRWFHLKIIC